MELLGCTIEEFRKHLSDQFVEGMTWENHGVYTLDNPEKWHIDHIIPCASFNLVLEEEQKKCFHYTNMQPLWGLQNIQKSAKLDWVKENALLI